MDDVIRTTGLQKRSGETRAVDGLDLSVAEGEVHGFLGPNGAGKTTTLRLLLGLLYPDGGEATLLGGDPWRDAAALHGRLAYVPGDVSLWPNLTGGERSGHRPGHRRRDDDRPGATDEDVGNVAVFAASTKRA